MSDLKPDRFERERLKKLEKIEALGLDPWGQRFDRHLPIRQARAMAPQESKVDGEKVRIAGRMMSRRKAGKLRFFDIQDSTGRIQLMFSRGDLSEQQWELLGALDLGDLVGIDGSLRRTDTGEISIFVHRLTMLCKSLAQPPEKYHKVKDVEILLRHRHLDLIYNEGVLQRMLKRAKMIDSVRQTLRGENFVEVETPVLHAIAGGAAARPFTTHHNALDMPLYLRIALELHLKRLMVGGIERVYEIGRVFRNEGIDATHNPEFTMIEIYQAYGNYETMMDLTEAIITDAVKAISPPDNSPPPSDNSTPSPNNSTPPSDNSTPPPSEGGARGGRFEGDTSGDRSKDASEDRPTSDESLILPWGETTIDFTPPWPRRKYADLFAEYAGSDVIQIAKQHGIKTEGVHPDVIVNDVFEATVEKHLTGPLFVIDYPASICPLTKRKRDNPGIAERFELFIQGMEIANAYTELNDPRLQEELFRTQLAGLPEEDSMAKMDQDFVRALKVGMPPAGGLGLGIDRLVMLLTDSRSIRDVIFFPLLRPEQEAGRKPTRGESEHA